MLNITMNALIGRIRRKLSREAEYFHKTRGMRWYNDLGDYYCSDSRNNITMTHVDPVELGRELGVLRPDEAVVE